MLVLWISVELGTVDTIGVAIVRGVSLFKLHHLFSFHLVINSNDWLTARRHQLGPVEGVIKRVQLLVDRIGVISQSGQQFS